MAESTLDVRWVVVTVTVLPRTIAEHFYDVPLQQAGAVDTLGDRPPMLCENRERHVEDRALTRVAPQYVSDGLSVLSWAACHALWCPFGASSIKGYGVAYWEAIFGGDAEWLADRILTFDLTHENARATLAGTGGGTREQAFRTILKNRTYHGGILAPGATFIKHGENGKGLKSRWYAETLAKRITAIGQVRERFTFVCGDGIEVMRSYARRKRAAFFIDPPYTAGGSNGKRAGTRLYTHHELDHERLFATAEKVAGDVLLTYDDAPDVRDLAERHGFKVEAVAMKNTHHAKMNELLVGRNLSWVC